MVTSKPVASSSTQKTAQRHDQLGGDASMSTQAERRVGHATGWLIEEAVRFVRVGPHECGWVTMRLAQADAHTPALGDGPAGEADVGGGLAHHRLSLIQA